MMLFITKRRAQSHLNDNYKVRHLQGDAFCPHSDRSEQCSGNQECLNVPWRLIENTIQHSTLEHKTRTHTITRYLMEALAKVHSQDTNGEKKTCLKWSSYPPAGLPSVLGVVVRVTGWIGEGQCNEIFPGRGVHFLLWDDTCKKYNLQDK